MAVHGDDFVSEGELADLRWVDAQLHEHFQIKPEVDGADPSLAKEAKLRNRVISWSEEGIYLEPDPRHIELSLGDLQLDAGRSTPLSGAGLREHPRHKGPASGEHSTASGVHPRYIPAHPTCIPAA